jgi:muramidase (phage lysozyme)
MADPIELIAALEHPNVAAFLRMIRKGEGTSDENGYRRMFGGELFDSFADHPRRAITKKLGGKPITSTAAGAPQFLSRTWDGLVKQYGFADFSPKNQDLGCVALIKGRKALDDVMAGRFEQAVLKCNKEWASLPGSPYGQPVVTMAEARAEYERHGGSYADQPAAVTTMAPDAGVTPPNPFLNDKEPPMAPFLAAALPSVIGAVPELLRMFGSGSLTSDRNIKAAEVVVGIAKDAIGARNEQELIESLGADPQAAAAVRQAVREQWFRIEEVGGGIQAARAAATAAQGDKSILHNPAFLISLLLLVFPLMLLVDVFFVHPDSYSADGLRTQIVTGVLMVISMIGGFWLGTSFSSSKNDDAILNRV